MNVLKFAHDDSDKSDVIVNKSVATFLKKSVHPSLLQKIEGKTPYETYTDLVIMAPN